MSERLTAEARAAVLVADIIARTSVSQKIETDHLLIGLMHENPGFLNRFLTTKVTGETLREAIQQRVTKGEKEPKSTGMPQRTEECQRVIALAGQEAERVAQENIGIDHLLIAILREENCTAAKMLRERGADVDLIRFHLAAAPYQPPSEKELKLRALNRMVDLLDDSHPSASGRIGEIRNRIECSGGEEIGDLSDQLMEIMVERAAPDALPGRAPQNITNLTTETVRRLVFFAQFEAKRSGSSEVETDHLLLVILREQRRHLELFMPLANSKEDVCKEIEQTLRPGGAIATSQMSSSATRPPLSEECKRAQTYAREEADKLWSSRVGPEHLLLGLLREESNFAARIMRKYGAEPEKIRKGLAASPQPDGTKSNERLQ